MGGERLNRRADQLENTLVVLGRLTSEAGTLLDSLGACLSELTSLTAPICVRAADITRAHDNIAASKQAVDTLLVHLETPRRVKPVLDAGPSRALDAFLDALQQLQRSNAALQPHQQLAAVRAAVDRSQSMFDAALQACEAELLASLASAARTSGPSSAWIAAHAATFVTDANRAALTLTLATPTVLARLQRLAALLVDAGYLAVMDAYVGARDAALEQIMRAADDAAATPVPAGAEALDRTIGSWARKLRVLCILMLSEEALAQHLWSPAYHDAVFADVVGRHLRGLLLAGRAITEARRTPDTVFSLLEMHEHLASAQPGLQLVLGGNAQCAPLLAEASGLLNVLGAAAGAAFGEYHDAVARDPARVVVADGTIHPLTAQVLSYVKRLLSYKSAGPVLFGGSDSDKGDTTAPTQLGAGLQRLLQSLEAVLEAKAAAYKHEPLAAVFLMNNLHYIVWSVESSAAAALVGTEWLERLKDRVEEAGARYHEVTWIPLVRMLQVEGPPLSDMQRLKPWLKERFTRFNEAVERIAQAQAPWIIPDQPLRAAVKRVVKDDLLGPYQDFLLKYADVPFTHNLSKYVRFAASDVAGIVDDDLFTGQPLPSQKLSLKREKLEAMVL